MYAEQVERDEGARLHRQASPATPDAAPEHGPMEVGALAAEALFGQSPVGFALFDTALRVIRVNDQFAALDGIPAAEHPGLAAHDLLPGQEADRLHAALRRVNDSGTPVTQLRVVGRGRWALSLYRLNDAGGGPAGVAAMAVDVTGQQRAEREAARARRNLALINDAATHIGSTLDLETTARELLDVAVPHFCDLASVDLYSALLAGDDTPGAGGTAAPGEVRRVAGASAVAGAGRGPIDVGGTRVYPAETPYARALASGRTAVLPEEGEHADNLDGIIQSTLVVPMAARGTVLGLVLFSRTKGSEPFSERDMLLAEELASRAAVCLDNARLYRREHERALLLQRSLLPPGRPAASGLSIACRYLPGSTASEVGGDWFDVIPLPGHRTALVVGDVMGRGLRAAVSMGQLRTAVRTLAMLDLEPAEVLAALDEIARGLADPPTLPGPARGGDAGGGPSRPAQENPEDLSEIYLATCVYAVYDPVTRRCTFANAGHLPPVVVRPDDPPLMLDLPSGLPLGVGAGGEPFEEVDIELPDGALLALYTDGLVESRNHALEDGLNLLRRSLAAPARDLEDVCDHVLGALHPHHGEDDTALLMARIDALADDAVGDWTLPPQAPSVSKARELTRVWLSERGLDDLVDVAELLVSELVTNALRHGYGDIRLRLLRDRSIVCEVWDSALAQPRQRRARATDEGGRGLQLVGMLADRWGSRRTPRGKTVWFELALPSTVLVG
ncbi:protein kinase [Mangrovactinospora gilvigrisea]|uniref:Protein kinase n=1 Tax=Mangrovactinospora gilvigrisea TaxID=1428644 RepID=A0A1J7C741_9ACTN|nr:protein kinase [Mangrovactinospora gilvigrisea]